MRKTGKSLLTALLILSLFGAGIFAVASWTDQTGRRALYAELEQASEHCYAVEGRYPPDLEYLRLHYGVHTENRRYTVDYRRTAPDRAPEIHVSLGKGDAWA